MRLAILTLAFALLAACANISTPPLAAIHPSDPTWQPAPDHLVGGVLPQ
jgi:outer membrane biogenesis lipoprotein LolB